MIGRRVALSALLLGLAFGPAVAAGTPDAVHIARIEHDIEPVIQVRGEPAARQTLEAAMSAHRVPAVSIAVVDGGRIAWAKAYGLADVGAGRRATIHTVLQAGSISKPVAASAALRLVEQGRLALDRPINDALTSWRVPDNAFTRDDPVTLRHLLSHTGGLTVHGFPGYAVGTPIPSVVEVLDGKPPANTAAVVVDRKPGAEWRYSGGGTTIAQLAMTDVSRQSFAVLTRRLVLDPVGMTESTFEQPPRDLPSTALATGYTLLGAAVAGRYHIYPEAAAAGLWTTPTDLAKWAIALQNAYAGRPSRLMSKTSARTMLTPGLGKWGLGIEVEGAGDTLRFAHGGDDWGFKAGMVGYLSGGRAIVVMANGDGGLAVIEPLIQAVAREYGWKGLEPKIEDRSPTK